MLLKHREIEFQGIELPTDFEKPREGKELSCTISNPIIIDPMITCYLSFNVYRLSCTIKHAPLCKCGLRLSRTLDFSGDCTRGPSARTSAWRALKRDYGAEGWKKGRRRGRKRNVEQKWKDGEEAYTVRWINIYGS